MSNNELAWKIFEHLKEKGCEIGNASVPLIERLLDENAPTIPAPMLDAAAKAVRQTDALQTAQGESLDDLARHVAQAALTAAGVPALLAAREAIGVALFREGYDTGWTTEEAVECIEAMGARIAELEAVIVAVAALKLEESLNYVRGSAVDKELRAVRQIAEAAQRGG